MCKKRQQINKSHISACQQERGQLSQEITKLAKGLLKHYGKFRKEFKDRLGIFALFCKRLLSSISSGWKEMLKLLFYNLARYKLPTCSEQSLKMASEPNQKEKKHVIVWEGPQKPFFDMKERRNLRERERRRLMAWIKQQPWKIIIAKMFYVYRGEMGFAQAQESMPHV